MKRIYVKVLRGLCIFWLTCQISACVHVKETSFQVIVVHEDTREEIDSVKIRILSLLGGERKMIQQTLYTDKEGKVSGSFEAADGYQYEILAEKPFYEPILRESEGAFSHVASLKAGEANEFTLTLVPIMAAEPQVIAGEVKSVSAATILETLKQGGWNQGNLPRMQWGDIETLLAAGGDSLVIHAFPIKSGSKLEPDSARLGQVALWMVEAIRRDMLKGASRPLFLMPPSNVPVLGTRRGNPRLFNSKEALGKAHQAYLNWWENAQMMDTLRAARKNPLRGTGLSWM